MRKEEVEGEEQEKKENEVKNKNGRKKPFKPDFTVLATGG